MAEPGYASYEAYACRFTDREAWVYIDGNWHEFNAADVFVNARVVTPQDYDRLFPEVPPMPSDAFQSGG